MPSAKATVPRADTPISIANLTKLAVRFSEQPGPRPDGNLWIDIEIDLAKATALFHCMHLEHVGSHKKRKVTYRADQNCVLYFMNQNVSVFDTNNIPLTAHKEKAMPVKDSIMSAQADYEVYAKTTIESMAESKTGPHIVVP